MITSRAGLGDTIARCRKIHSFVICLYAMLVLVTYVTNFSQKYGISCDNIKQTQIYMNKARDPTALAVKCLNKRKFILLILAQPCPSG